MLSKFKRVAPVVTNFIKQSRASFTSLGSQNLSSQNKRERHQFSTQNLTDFGDLPTGEIPEALKYDRPVEISQLGNGVKVATQQWPGQLATISVFIKCGSRQETIENSGVAHFLEHLHFKGTKNRSRIQLELDVENMGGQLNAYTSRENTSYTMTVFKNDSARAVEILGDMLCNSLYDKNHVESERDTIYRECIETQKDQMETTIEAAHYTSFRDHVMGLPILGIRENFATISRDQIVEYHKTHYVGSNIVITGAGDISHQQLLELSEKYFGYLPMNPPAQPKNIDKPEFTPSLMYMRDDEMTNINVGIFFQAPSWTHEDYYSFLLYQRILGDYTEGRTTGAHLDYSERQYNTLHSILGQLPELSIQKSIYAPYSDTGLFGSYLHGTDAHSYQMLYVSQLVLADFANHLNPVEIVRAKNKLYNELLQHETGNDITQSIGNQLLYLNRIVPRSEIAKRVSSLEQSHLSRVARKWFLDTEVSAVAWGPIHALMALSHYNKPMKRSTLGWHGDSKINTL